MTHRALLLDRDGTLVRARHYPTQPADLQLFPGLGAALARFRQAGFRLIVITNQGGLALGHFDAAALDAMHAHLQRELTRQGAPLDAIYHCPHHPAGRVPALAIACRCRKPQPGLLQRAAADWSLDLARCWMIGDILDDVEAGRRAGCHTALVDNGGETEWRRDPWRVPDLVAPDTLTALARIAVREGLVWHAAHEVAYGAA